MKKLSLLASLTLFTLPVFAAFTGPSVAVLDTVQQAKQAADDAPVVLIGQIVQSLGNENYLFKDATGQIEVEIDHEDWRGQNVTALDKVTLRGEVDKNWTDRTIEVDYIVKN